MTNEELRIYGKIEWELREKIGETLEKLCGDKVRVVDISPQWERDGEWHFLILFRENALDSDFELLLNETDILEDLEEYLKEELIYQRIIEGRGI